MLLKIDIFWYIVPEIDMAFHTIHANYLVPLILNELYHQDGKLDLVQIYVTEQANWFISDQNLDVKNSYLSICSNSASTVGEKFWHVIVANKLPQTGLEVQISVEA